MGEKKEKIDRHSLMHFIAISLILYAFYGFITSRDILMQGCTLEDPCEDYVRPTYIMLFNIFKTLMIVFMIFRIPLLDTGQGLFTRKYFIFLFSFLIIDSFMDFISVYTFFNILG